MAPSRSMTAVFSLKRQIWLGIYLGEVGRRVLCQRFEVDLSAPARTIWNAGVAVGDLDRICQYFLVPVDKRYDISCMNRFGMLMSRCRLASVEIGPFELWGATET